MLPLRLPGPVYQAIVEHTDGPDARTVINEWYSRVPTTDGNDATAAFELRHDYRYIPLNDKL